MAQNLAERAAIPQPAAEPTAPLDAPFADGLTVDEAVALALAGHPGLAAELERLGIARADLRRAALPTNPVLSASWKFFEGPDEIELSLTQSFLDLLFLPMRRRVAESDRTAVEAEVTGALVHRLFEVRRAHAEALHAVEQRRLARDAAQAAVGSAELMDLLHGTGSVADLPRTLAQIGAARAQDGWLAAQLAETRAHALLALAMGLSRDAPEWQPVAAGADAPSAKGEDPLQAQDSALFERVVARSLALAAKRARAAAAAIRAGFEPVESLLAPADIGATAKHETSADWGIGPMATIALPLFDAGGNARGRAAAELRRSELEAEALVRELVAATQVAAAAARQLAARAKAAGEVDVPLHSRLVRETVQQYNAMQIGAFDVLAARELELDATRRAERLALAALLARIDLQELLAGGRPSDAEHDGERTVPDGAARTSSSATNNATKEH